MKNIFRHILFGAATCGLAIGVGSCEKRLEIDAPEHESKIVVNSIFNPDSTFEVEVTRTKAITAAQGPNYIPNAVVEIFEDGVLLESLQFRRVGVKGSYKASVAMPKTAHDYTVQVSAPNYTAVSSLNTIPRKVEVVDAAMENQVVNGTKVEADLVFDFQDESSEMNYYHVVLYRPMLKYNAATNTYEVGEYIKQDFELRDLNATENYNDGYIFTDADFNGQKKELRLSLNTYYDSNAAAVDHVLVELRSVSKDYYLYHKSFSEQHFNFDNRIIDVHTNVTNGYGIFAGYHSDTETVSF